MNNELVSIRLQCGGCTFLQNKAGLPGVISSTVANMGQAKSKVWRQLGGQNMTFGNRSSRTDVHML